MRVLVWKAIGTVLSVSMLAVIAASMYSHEWDRASASCLLLMILDKAIERNSKP